MLRAIFLIALLSLPGCLMFREQVITAEYDAAADRLTLHIVYLGLHANGDPDKAVTEFTDTVNRNHVCLLEWPFTYAPEDAAESDHPLARFLVANVKTHRVGFFKDALGRLCGGQIVVIENFGQMLKLVNVSLTEEALPDAMEKADAETRALNVAAAAKGHAWLRMRGQAIELSFFASDHDFERMKRDLLEELFSDTDNLAAAREWLARNPVSIVREGKEVRLVLGNPKAPLRLVAPPQGREPYTDVLEKHVEKTWGLGLDAEIGPLLVAPPQRLPPERLRALVARLDADDPRLADAAARELLRAEGNVAELEEIGAGLSLDARRRLRSVLAELKRPHRAFARYLPRAERIRLMLAQPGGEAREAALRAEIARLPFPPEEPPADPAAYLRDWLGKWIEARRDGE
jgi:hypothetical protein